MKKSLSKAMSIAITVAMLFALLVPVTFVSAAVDPVMELSIVDEDGAPVESLYPGTSAFVRVDISGLEQIFNAAVSVNAVGAEFGAKENLVKRYSEYDALKDINSKEILCIDTGLGVSSTASTMSIGFTESTDMTVIKNLPIAIEAFTLVDIPFTVTASVGQTVSFTFGTDSTDTYVAVENGRLGKYYVDHPTQTLEVTGCSETVEDPVSVIKGSVTASDTTGQVEDFSEAIPVGAVITAIKHDENAMGNYTGTAEMFDAVSTVVDSRGNFKLEVEPGVYTVIVSHTKYSIYGGEVFVARTILDSNTKREVEIVKGETVNLGNIELKYTYFGDLNLDGALNTTDFRTFTQCFGSSIR